ncbi:hypothetical protein ACHAXA_000768 [Cyclostephanos tholiformis]|uniref:PiggyBac transposable element-derived protein domain-containing protein n=1 Tax=Cyclostephanos tholiformis TaxID=382380 RepID=A0ABD3RE83_9STRA
MVSTSKLSGIGAIGSAASCLFHPGDKVREKYPKDAKLHCVNVEITSEGLRRIKNEAKMCYLISIPKVEGECYIVKKCFRVEQSPDTPFKSERTPLRCDIPHPLPHGKDRTALFNVVRNVGNGLADEVLELRAQGLEVDNDNEPLNEGAGAPPPLEYSGPHNFTVPMHCPRHERNMIDESGKWAYHHWDEIVSMTEFELFRMAFPEDFVKDVIIPRTNDNLGLPLMLGEFYKWLGCNFFMACFQGIPDRKCWTPTVEWDGYEDRFHEMRKMIDEFNNHYAHSYHPSWLNCLDESMSSWLNKFCPGFMCVPRKPHPFGNEYHLIADGDDGKSIMWHVKLVEGKDRPKKAGGQWVFLTQFPGYGKTMTTMLEMTKPIHGKGKVVVGDSGFCVQQGVVECHKRGKKQGNWPRGVPGAAIDMYFDDMELGHYRRELEELQIYGAL